MAACRRACWLGFDKAAWKSIQSEAREREAAGLAALKPVIHGSDIDPAAIQAARENAEVAGVAHAIRFTRADVADLAAPEQEIGAVVCNPPYDERLAADPALYRALGNALQKAVPQWRASLLCGNDELAFATGLRASKKYQMFNGALECALIVCDPIAVPGRDPAQPRELSEGAQMVANRLRKNLKKFKSWRAREDITCFRAYDADLPEYAAAIDVYEEEGAGGVPSCMCRNTRHRRRFPRTTRRRRNELLAAAREVFGVPPEQVSMKSRERGKGGSKYGRFEQRDEFIVVREQRAAAGEPVRLPGYRPVPRPSPAAPDDGRAGAWQAFPQPVLLHRRGQRAGRRGRCRQHHQRRPVGHLSAVVLRQPGAERAGATSICWSRPMQWPGWKATAASTT